MNDGQKMADKSPTEMEKFIETFKKTNSEYRQNLDWLGRLCRRLLNEPEPSKTDKEKMPSSGHLSSFIECSQEYTDCNSLFAMILQRLDKII